MINGANNSLGNLFELSNAKSRSISAENPTGEKGGGARCEVENGTAKRAARELGRGWKVNPYINIQAGETAVLADIDGPGVINQIWCTPSTKWRYLILRFYWDGCENPSVECPLGDFFACGWGEYAPVSSLAVCVNPGKAFNCYWQMPFKRKCRITLENIGDKSGEFYYQINYSLTELPEDIGYFHAQFRRVNPQPYLQEYTLLDGVSGKGQYVGTYMAWGQNSNGWWGEGEMKFYLDGDGEFPTICGTGLEDYFCGSYGFENGGKYETYTTPYAGFCQVIKPDGLWKSQQRFGLYRWHITDPIRFDLGIRVTMQALGWRDGGRYLPLTDDIASVSFWYQTLPTEPFPSLPAKDILEII